jgi:hypothetical protein
MLSARQAVNEIIVWVNHLTTDEVLSVGASDGLRSAVHAELHEYVLYVIADRSGTDVESACNFALPKAMGEKPEYFVLPRGEAGPRWRWGRFRSPEQGAYACEELVCEERLREVVVRTNV